MNLHKAIIGKSFLLLDMVLFFYLLKTVWESVAASDLVKNIVK